jgi:hypothetical protein
MVKDVVMAVVMSIGVFAGVLALLAVLFRAQVRRYDRVVATDLLDDWRMQVELLDPGERERALQAPPPNVVAAMASLPSSGLSGGWNEGPVSSFDTDRPAVPPAAAVSPGRAVAAGRGARRGTRRPWRRRDRGSNGS